MGVAFVHLNLGSIYLQCQPKVCELGIRLFLKGMLRCSRLAWKVMGRACHMACTL